MDTPQQPAPETSLKKRERTESVAVYFTGDEETDYQTIKKNHLKSGLLEIGYHYVIESDGKILMGRHPSKTGAHHPEWDETSIGVCVIGERNNLNFDQNIAYTLLMEKLANDFPSAKTIKYFYKESH